VWAAAKKYPKIDGKLKLFIEFYGKLSTEFTEESFQEFVPKK
jgi:hypothetical protein